MSKKRVWLGVAVLLAGLSWWLTRPVPEKRAAPVVAPGQKAADRARPSMLDRAAAPKSFEAPDPRAPIARAPAVPSPELDVRGAVLEHDPEDPRDRREVLPEDEEAVRRGSATNPFPSNGPGIQEAVRSAKPALRECYEGWLQAMPELKGKVTMAFEIEHEEGEAAARVTRSEITSSELDQPILEGCIINAFSGLHFEPPEGGKLSVKYPLYFDDTPLDGGVYSVDAGR